MTDPKLIDHTLNNGALIMLAQLLNAPGLLTDAKDLRHAGDVAEMEPFLELPKIPDFPEGTKTDLDRMAHVRTWQRTGEHRLPLKAAQREAIRKLVKTAMEKGAGSAGPDTRCLLREFGVGDE
jgi:hypothetical protein